MTFRFWPWFCKPSASSPQSRRCPCLESLEDRLLPSAATIILPLPPLQPPTVAVLQANLTSAQPESGSATVQDDLTDAAYPGKESSYEDMKKGASSRRLSDDQSILSGALSPPTVQKVLPPTVSAPVLAGAGSLPPVTLPDPASVGGPTAPVPFAEDKVGAEPVTTLQEQAPCSPPPQGPLNEAEGLLTQTDFQTRLDSFARPPAPPTVAQPAPVAESNLALVGALLPDRPAEPSATRPMPANDEAALPLNPGTRAPAPPAPAPGTNFLAGAQEAIDQHLAATHLPLPATPPQVTFSVASAATPQTSTPTFRLPDESSLPPLPEPVGSPSAVPVAQAPEDRDGEAKPDGPVFVAAFDLPEAQPFAAEPAVPPPLADILFAAVPPPAPEEDSTLPVVSDFVLDAVFAVGFTQPWWLDEEAEARTDDPFGEKGRRAANRG